MNKKLLLGSLCFGFLISCACAFTNAAKTAQDISQSVIRLHIRAQSDSSADQQIKLQVRNAVIDATKGLLDCTENRTQAEDIIKKNLGVFENAANRRLLELGAPYSASVRYGLSDFPTKAYGAVKLPAGNYSSLIIDLGSASGHNWWCVMYPPLCYQGESYEADDPTLAVLKQSLPQDEYYVITGGKNTIVKFKTVELAAKLKNLFIKK